MKKIKRIIKLLYLKIVGINDTPERVALGLGLGVFLGLMPGSGPIAALTLAIVFKVNRFAALMGSLATNTWLSIVFFIPAVKLGAAIMNLSWRELYREWAMVMAHFRWAMLLKISLYRIILPVVIGYVIIALMISILVYLSAKIALGYKKHANKN